MPDLLTFPNFPQASNSWNLSANVITPGQTADGEFPLARFDGGGRWVATLSEMYLRDTPSRKLFRALRIASRGGSVPLVIPRFDEMLRPFPAGYTGPVRVTHSDGTTFSDGTKYRQSAIIAKVVGAASLNDTSLTIRMVLGSDLIGGESFSLLHVLQNWRLYEICSVQKLNATDFLVGFDPPLRDDIADGSDVEFEEPRCVMRVRTPASFNVVMQAYPFQRPTVEFVEQVFRV